jgi:hypothetical protein
MERSSCKQGALRNHVKEDLGGVKQEDAFGLREPANRRPAEPDVRHRGSDRDAVVIKFESFGVAQLRLARRIRPDLKVPCCSAEQGQRDERGHKRDGQKCDKGQLPRGLLGLWCDDVGKAGRPEVVLAPLKLIDTTENEDHQNPDKD